jgi:Fe-S-cluster containining protein
MDHRADFESTEPTPCGLGSDRAAAWLGKEYLRRVGRRYSLTEDKNSGDCCFLRHREGKRVCGIYPVRPLQCRTWPFWERNLESPQAWAEAARECPGINRGSRYDFVQIEVRRTAGSSEELPE